MKIILVLLLAGAALAACAQLPAAPVAAPSTPVSQPASKPAAGASSLTPTIVIFEAAPPNIKAGDPSALTWEITNATSVNINQGIGQVALKGNMAITPASTVTYTLSATNKYGSSTATAQVTVTGTMPVSTPDTFHLPVVAVLTVQPANIVSGQTAVLMWEVQNAFDVAISPGLSIIPPKGSREVSPAFSTTYKLTTTNNNGTIIATTTLTVSGVPPGVETPVIKFFTATPYVIKKGESAILSWQSTEGSSASIDKGVGIIDGSGTTRVTPAETTTYMLTVTNPRGAQFQTTTVNVK